MKIDPNGVLATPSVMIGRSSDFPSPSSPSRPECSPCFNLHGDAGTSRKCPRRPIRKTAYPGSDFSPGQGFTGTSLNDQRPHTWRIRYRLGIQHRPACGGISPPSLFIRNAGPVRSPPETDRLKPPRANTDHVYICRRSTHCRVILDRSPAVVKEILSRRLLSLDSTLPPLHVPARQVSGPAISKLLIYRPEYPYHAKFIEMPA